MSLILDGTAGITFPSGSGTQAAQSKVLQVIQSTLTSTVSTSSSSYVTTGLSASITPLFNTSKVLILVAGGSIDNNGSGGQAIGVTIYKNGSNLPSTTSMAVMYSGNTRVATPLAINYLDSPASTSAQTYTVYFASTNNAGTVIFNSTSPSAQSQTTTLTLMEIAA